jgi:hypothetical protein
MVGLPLASPVLMFLTSLLIADVYRIPLAAPAVMAKEIKTRARFLEPILEGVEIKHPLVQLTYPPVRFFI